MIKIHEFKRNMLVMIEKIMLENKEYLQKGKMQEYQNNCLKLSGISIVMTSLKRWGIIQRLENKFDLSDYSDYDELI